MSRGKYLSLEEARNMGKLDRFAKEHPSRSKGNRFERLLDAVARGSLEGDQTSTQALSEDYSGTQTRPGTSEDV